MEHLAQADGIKIRGFYRLQITEPNPGETPEIVGDSGWLENVVVNLGFLHYLVNSLGSIAGSKYITHAGVGTGAAPGAADTTLAGETDKRTSTVNSSTVAGSKTLRMTMTFGSSDSFVTAARNVSNIGLFNTSAAGSLFAGNTYASSSCATNQNINATCRAIVRHLLETVSSKFRKFGENLLVETIPSQAASALA